MRVGSSYFFPFVVSARRSCKRRRVYRTTIQNKSSLTFLTSILLIISCMPADAAVRNFNTRINASGISQEELENPLKAVLEIEKRSRELLVVPIKVYFGALPHQLRKQWLIELYDLKRDQRLVCPVKQVKWP